MSARQIAIAAAAEVLLEMTCHGCKHCHYSAPDGQAWNKAPHSRCKELRVDVPMILGERGKWLGSEIPRGCPEHAQPELFA